jgi:hypothetical protein
MALFVDLEEEDAEPPLDPRSKFPEFQAGEPPTRHAEEEANKSVSVSEPEAQTSPVHNVVTEAFGCYPYALAPTPHLLCERGEGETH